MSNKPWEGKHWLKTFSYIQEMMDENDGDLCLGLARSRYLLHNALKNDWEEQQENLRFSADFSEKQIQRHMEKGKFHHEEWGGCLRAIIDGKPQNIADHMNKKYMEDKACAQTAEKEKSGRQESFERGDCDR